MTMYSRMANGVKTRSDGKGDEWARAHRSLGRGNQMHDVDALFGAHVFGHNTGEKLFLEYEPDHYEKRMNAVRSFAVVAMFDRKTSEAAAFGQENKLSRDLYLWQCRVFATAQPIPPRFFIVVGGQEPPWTMHELCINTGERLGHPVDVDGRSFSAVWNRLGLTRLRSELRRWVTG